MSDMVCSISIAHAAGMAVARSPPTASHAARHRHGRTRLPPASSEYLEHVRSGGVRFPTRVSGLYSWEPHIPLARRQAQARPHALAARQQRIPGAVRNTSVAGGSGHTQKARRQLPLSNSPMEGFYRVELVRQRRRAGPGRLAVNTWRGQEHIGCGRLWCPVASHSALGLGASQNACKRIAWRAGGSGATQSTAPLARSLRLTWPSQARRMDARGSGATQVQCGNSQEG